MLTYGGVDSATSNASGTTLTITTSSLIPAGAIVFLGVASDNTAANLPNVTVTAFAGEQISSVFRSDASTTPGATLRVGYFLYRTLMPIPASTSIEITFSAAVTGKAAALSWWTPGDYMVTHKSTSQSSTTATSLALTMTEANSGSSLLLYVGGVEWESATADSEWTTRANVSSGGSGDAGVTLVLADKVPTGGTNTYTVSAPSSTFIAELIASLNEPHKDDCGLLATTDCLLPIGPLDGGGASVPTVGQIWPRGNW